MATIKTHRGLAWANIKTHKTLAAANIKAIGGVSAASGKTFSSGQSPDAEFVVNGLTVYVSQQFTTDQAYTNINSATLILRKTGTVSGTMKVGFFANSSGKPSGSVIGAWSDDVNLSVLTTLDAGVAFQFSTKPSLNTATSYHIVVFYNGTFTSFNKTHTRYYDAAGIDNICASSDGVTYSEANFNATATLVFSSDS